MNIFITSLDPIQCAKDHCVVHQTKMIVEYAQLLSTAHHVMGTSLNKFDLYAQTHANHPCAIWVRESLANYRYTLELALELCKLYSKRTARRHASQDILELLRTPPLLSKFEMGDIITRHAQAMPDKYKNSDVTVAYTKYLIDKYIDWINHPRPINVRWNKGCTPSWYKP